MSRNWTHHNYKGILPSYDDIIVEPLNTDARLYCLTDNQVEALRVLIEPLIWHTRWYSANGYEIDQALILEFVAELDKRLMDDCCCGGQTSDGSAPQYRYNYENTQINYEISYDGGETWVTAPEWPIALIPQLPPPVGNGYDSKCDAAINGVGHFTDVVNAHSAAYDTASSVAEFIITVAGFMLVMVFAPAAVPIVIPILFAAAVAAFSIGKTAWDAYWTSEVYDIVTCMFYCNIGEDGQFDAAGYEGFMADLGSMLPAGIPRDMLYRDYQFLGLKGLNQSVAYGIVVSGGDCSACGCGECTTWVYATEDGEPTGAFDGTITPISDTVFRAATGTIAGDGKYYIGLKADDGGTCIIVSAEAISGSIFASFITPEPNDNNCDFSHLVSGGASFGDCAWAIVCQCLVPTVVEFTVTGC